MPSVHLTCPCCRRNLLSPRLIAPGEKLRCPYCSGQFRAGIDDRRRALPRRVGPRRAAGYGIVLAWLLFANLLLLGGGVIAVAVYLGHREQPQDVAKVNAPAAPARRRLSVCLLPAGRARTRAASACACRSCSGPSAKKQEPAPAPDTKPDFPVNLPKPPPLPGPAPREPERKIAAKEKPPEPAKPREESPVRREAPQASWLPASCPETGRSLDRRGSRVYGGNSTPTAAGEIRWARSA